MTQLRARVNENANASNWYVLVTGLERPSEPVRLAPGVTLRPLPHRLTVFDIFAATTCGFQTAASLADIVYHATAGVETALDNAIDGRFDALNRAWLGCTLLVGLGHNRVMCPAALSRPWGDLSAYDRGTWESPASGHPKVRTDLRLSGTLLDLHQRMLVADTTGSSTDLPKHATRVMPVFDIADRLCAESEQFVFALRAMNDWRFSPDMRAGVARIWAGIEALLGVSAEISFRIALISAALLHPRGQARLDRYRQIRSLYNARSKAVHGDKMSSEQLAEAAAQSCRLLQQLLWMCLDLGAVPSSEQQEQALLM